MFFSQGVIYPMLRFWRSLIWLWVCASSFSFFACNDPGCIRHSDCSEGKICSRGACVFPPDQSIQANQDGNISVSDAAQDQKPNAVYDLKVNDAPMDSLGKDSKASDLAVDAPKSDASPSDASVDASAGDQ